MFLPNHIFYPVFAAFCILLAKVRKKFQLKERKELNADTNSYIANIQAIRGHPSSSPLLGTIIAQNFIYVKY